MQFHDETDGHRAFALAGARLRYGPDKTVDVEHVDLHLTPDLDAQSLDGVCTTTVRALDEPVEHLQLNAVDLEVSSVERGGKPAAFTVREGILDVQFDPPIAAGARTEFRVAYRTVRPRHGLFFIAPTPAYPQKVRHAWTQSQDENARFWFPCLDYPHAKSTTSTTVVVRKGLFALANGALTERRDDGETTVFSYRQDIAHSTYLMTFVVGPFSEIEQNRAGVNNVPVWYYTLPGCEADGERCFAKTPAMIEKFEERVGAPYPYARYSQIAVADFIFGGMENTSATTQTDRVLHDEIAHLDYSADFLVAHELAHQWFGDLLTCRDWSQAWLNEGFATYFEAVWRESDLGYDEYLYDVFGCVARYLDEDAGRYRRPIVCNRYRDPIELFDRHLYEKGGAVLHMLRGELGDARFWRCLRHYVAQNAGRNVETIDLIRAIEEASGRNLRGFFDQWVFRGGHPELEVSAVWDKKNKAITLTIDQKQHVDDASPAYAFSVDVGFVASIGTKPAADFGTGTLAGERRLRIAIERAHETITVPLDWEPKLVRFDPGSFILGDVTYKLGLDFAVAAVTGDADPVARIRAARELVKDGSARAREALCFTLRDDPFWGVQVELASALGATKALWARALLLEALTHPHPKVRRAVASALGAFRDTGVADALIARYNEDRSYFVRAATLASLGKTRDVRAFEILNTAIVTHTWNATVEGGAARGLAELADERVVEPLIAATTLGRDEGLRRVAVDTLARVGNLMTDARARVVDALDRLLDDSMFLVQLAAITAAETLEDARLLPTLDRLSASGVDGRVRRDAAEAAIRIREAAKTPAAVSSLRTDLDSLREDQRKLQEKIETLARS
jgi:aminopeptidase N